MKVCAIIPTYENAQTIERVVAGARRHVPDVAVIDDGSGPEARAVLDTLRCTVLTRMENGGKGAAIKAGLQWAAENGFDHAVALDADLQHDPDDIPKLLAAVDPTRPTLVLGQPVFDESAPRHRMFARQLSVFWVMIETWGKKVGDPLCGFRVYPVAAALATKTRGNAMDFDPEMAVRLVWAGVAVAHVPVRVVYPTGNVSHYRGLTDTLLISLLHSRLCLEGIWRFLSGGAVADWRKIPEAGTVWGIRFVVFLARFLGRRVAGGFLFVLSLYYVAFRAKARRASHDYLRRVGQPSGLAATIRHIFTFARVSLDRLFFLTGDWSPFVVESHGHELLRGAAQSGRGALLLGAHLGSFEVMRSRAEASAVPVNVMVDFSNAQQISSVLRQLAPAIDTRLLSLDTDPLTAMLAVKDCIDRGEIVAILADRMSKSERHVTVRFLGEPANLPAGPWLLAHALRCPVLFVAGIYRAPNRYDLHCEVLAEEVVLGRADRNEALERYAQRYAATVEKYARAAPLNWFNFYDFWSRP